MPVFTFLHALNFCDISFYYAWNFNALLYYISAIYLTLYIVLVCLHPEILPHFCEIMAKTCK